MENRLIVLRAEKRMSQADLAKLAGISRSTLSQIENEKVTPDGETIAKLVKALNVPAGEIFSALCVV
jgi:putative transcriptional regulator